MAIANVDRQIAENTKEKVHYRHYESCATCIYFNGRIACQKVEGHVSPQGLCDLWTMQEHKPPKTGKEQILEAYEAEQKRKNKIKITKKF